MNIVGIGIDIVSIPRIKKIFKKFGNKFAKKILSNKEWIEFLKKSNKSNFIAKKFAAKEAAAKALGTGFRNKISFHNFEILHNDDGKPDLIFLQYAKYIASNLCITSVKISITDEKKYACAVVIIE